VLAASYKQYTRKTKQNRSTIILPQNLSENDVTSIEPRRVLTVVIKNCDPLVFASYNIQMMKDNDIDWKECELTNQEQINKVGRYATFVQSIPALHANIHLQLAMLK
jgi:hypothetical protein